jgi:hypothetical protein
MKIEQIIQDAMAEIREEKWSNDFAKQCVLVGIQFALTKITMERLAHEFQSNVKANPRLEGKTVEQLNEELVEEEQ